MRWWPAACIAVVLALAPPSLADEQTRQRALEDYRAGRALFREGAYERSLDFFLRSRRLHANAANVGNAAESLYKLGRYDEAYAMFREAVRDFPEQLSADKRAEVDRALAEIEQRIATIAVTGTALGLVVIDGRAHGRLPLAEPVAVMPGDRLVRVLQDGYATFERVVSVRARQRLELDAQLEPLAESGELEIEDPQSPGSTVYVDRAPIGTSPWRGVLGPGEHVVWTLADERGSAPQRVIVVQGQRVVATAHSAPLGPRTRIAVEPPTASLTLDGVPLGAGTWEGRLPVGRYSLVATEPGYHGLARTVVAPAGGDPVTLQITLRIDRNHPRWPQPLRGKLWLALQAGPVLGTSLRSGPEGNCDVCAQDPSTLGVMASARGGYRFPIGLSLELTGGYLHLGSEVRRELRSEQAPVSLRLRDDIALDGGLFAAGASQRAWLGPLAIDGRLGLGALISRARIRSAGEVLASDGSSAAVALAGEPDGPSGASLFVQAELVAGTRLFDVEIGAGVGLVTLLTDGPIERGRTTVVELRCSPDATAGCTPTGEPIADDRAHGPTLLFTPQAHVRYEF